MEACVEDGRELNMSADQGYSFRVSRKGGIRVAMPAIPLSSGMLICNSNVLLPCVSMARIVPVSRAIESIYGRGGTGVGGCGISLTAPVFSPFALVSEPNEYIALYSSWREGGAR